MDINLDELREAVELMRELRDILVEISPSLRQIQSLKGDVIVPVSTERYIERGKVCEILNIGSAAVTTLVNKEILTPFYIGDSNNMKFALSEVLKIPKPANRKHK